jgi:hypothetical protein
MIPMGDLAVWRVHEFGNKPFNPRFVVSALVSNVCCQEISIGACSGSTRAHSLARTYDQ